MTPNRALVVFAHGIGLALCYSSDENIKQFINDAGGSYNTFDVERAGVDFDTKLIRELGDGVYIVDMRLIDDGPGDYPGTRETALQFTNMRKATLNEWDKYRAEEWSWEMPT